MTITKIAILAATMTFTLAGSARADAILALGFWSSDSSSTAPGFAAPASAASSVNLAPVASMASSYPPSIPQVSPSPSPTPSYDAFINFQNGPFAGSSSLTTGNPQAWYDSPNIVGLFGGRPNAQQVGNFDAAVLGRVEQTFQLSGVPVSLTVDPNASAAHSLSVVSNAVNPTNTGAIGMTTIGGDGFHFIDNAASYARSVDQLEWIVAHNMAHELMLAFGVPEVHDQSGRYIDSTVGSMAMFLDPSARFSTGAVQDLLSKDFRQVGGGGLSLEAQMVGSATVPEPATLAAWSFGALALIVARRARSRRASA